MVPKLQRGGRDAAQGRRDRRLIGFRRRQPLRQRQLVNRFNQLREKHRRFDRAIERRMRRRHHRHRILRGQCVEHCPHAILLTQPQNFGHPRGVQTAAGIGDGLIEQAQGIAHRAISRLRHPAQGRRFKGNGLLAEHGHEVLLNLRRRQRAQGKLQAARQHRDRQFLRIGGGEQEFDMCRRFFQRFKQGVEARFREHVHFVDQVDLEAPANRGVVHIVEQFAGVIDAGARRGIHFDQIHEAAFVDFPTGRAHTAGRAAHAGFAI